MLSEFTRGLIVGIIAMCALFSGGVMVLAVLDRTRGKEWEGKP